MDAIHSYLPGTVETHRNGSPSGISQRAQTTVLVVRTSSVWQLPSLRSGNQMINEPLRSVVLHHTRTTTSAATRVIIYMHYAALGGGGGGAAEIELTDGAAGCCGTTLGRATPANFCSSAVICCFSAATSAFSAATSPDDFVLLSIYWNSASSGLSWPCHGRWSGLATGAEMVLLIDVLLRCFSELRGSRNLARLVPFCRDISRRSRMSRIFSLSRSKCIQTVQHPIT